MVELFAMEYMTALGMTMVLLFLDSKYPRWVTALAVYVVMVLVMGVVAVLYCTAGLAVTVRAYTLLAHAPSLLLLLFFSRFRGWRMLFQLMSAILFCMLTQHAAGLVYYLSGQRFWVMALSYAVLTVVVICFLVRFLRPLFFQTLEGLRHGWWLACLAMALYYGIVVYVIPGYVGLDQVTTVLKPAVSLLMVGFYMVLMLLFTSTRKEMEAQHGKRLVEAQAAALRSRLEALGAAEEETRLMRHDMRHRFQTVAELVGRGEDQRALAFIGAAQRKLDEGKPVRWCGLAVLDAVFASYFGQAQRQGVRVEADIRLQEPLPVDEGELAIVFANALENALHACLKLPEDKRWIACKAICYPKLMFQVVNPWEEEVPLDGEGLPVTGQEDHGLGVHSIAAFCQKYGALCQFTQEAGEFSLRVIL